MLFVVRAVVCCSVAIISTHSCSDLANVNHKCWFATGSVQRRVTACQMTVYVDICVSHDIADRG